MELRCMVSWFRVFQPYDNHKEWLVNLDENKKSKVMFVENLTILVECVDDVMIMRKNGKYVVISKVLYDK